MKYIIYKNESYKLEENNPLICYENLNGREELQNEEKKRIYNYIRENYKYYDKSLNDSFMLLFNYLNTYTQEKEAKINDLINTENDEEKKYIRFDNMLSNYFKEEGKEITIGKLLNSFLYMEKLCFGFLVRDDKDNRNDSDRISKLFLPLDEQYKKLINEYFTNQYNDKIISKNKFATALRRYIIRYLSAIKDNNALRDLPIFAILKKADLWDNEIIKKMKDFPKKIEEYIGKLKHDDNKPILKGSHAYEFYKIIGKEDEENIIKEISEFDSDENNFEKNFDQNDLDNLDL